MQALPLTLALPLRLALPLIAALVAPPALAQIQKSALTVELTTVAAGLSSPVQAIHAGDGSGRLFIVDQIGEIRILQNGVLLPAAFLDIAARMVPLNAGFDERGLLGLAFHPGFASNGRFFVRYSAPRDGDPSDPCFGTPRGCHAAVLAEFQVDPSDPNRADETSERVLLRVDEPQFNHNSGDLAFGPDGFLYVGLGDGGGAHDGLADSPPSHGPNGHGQNTDTLLGSILRLDVDVGAPCGIPADNPFVGEPGADEIFAYGFRNPYRFSFDDGPGGDGALYVGDVGQALFEEVSVVRSGENHGWVVREGFHCFDPFAPSIPPDDCPSVGALGEPLVDPIAEYVHADGGLSVIGGYVYRGTQNPALACRYVFGDFSGGFGTPAGRLYFLVEPTPGQFAVREFTLGSDDRPLGLYLKGMGEDEAGELYICGSTALNPFGDTGVVQRISVLGSNYCVASPNSSGAGAEIGFAGTPGLSAGDFELRASGLPAQASGLFFFGAGKAQIPFGDGVLCVSPFMPGLVRLNPLVRADAGGSVSRGVDFDSAPASGIQPGSTQNFQLWYRDGMGGPEGFNTSDAVEVTFCP